MIYFIQFILICLLTYINNPFYFKGIEFINKLFYYSFSFIPIVLVLLKKIVIDDNYRLFCITSLFVLASSFLLVCFSNNYNISYIIYFVRNLIQVFSSISVFIIWAILFKNRIIEIDYCDLFINSVVLYIVGSIIFILFPFVKDTWCSIIVEYNKHNLTLMSQLENITRIGFAGFSGFGCAFMVVVAKILSVFLFLYNNDLKKYYKYSVLLLIGSVLYGRVGFVVIILLELYLNIYMCFKRKDKSLLGFNMNVVVFVVIIGILLYLMLPNTQVYFKWLLEPIFNFFEKGSISSASTSQLGEMYSSFKMDELVMLIGTGQWANSDGSYYGHVDVGVLRNIYFGGIPYTIIFYSFCIMPIYMILIILKKLQFKPYFMIGFVICSVFVIFELKGDIAFLFLKMFLPFLLYLYSIYNKNYYY